MNTALPYQLSEPEALASAVIFSSPHSGCAYPEDLVRDSRLDSLALRASEDAYVDTLFAEAPLWGAPLIAATAPRAYVDLNRAPEEMDPAVVQGVRASGLNPRVAAGLGVIPRIVAEGRPIYNGKITLEAARRRIEQWHTPYHNQLEVLIARAADHFGYALLFDCHSMPTDALRSAPKVRGKRPEIVIGDRFGTSASRQMVLAAVSAFEAAGFVVVCNAPFAGGHITQRYVGITRQN